jgi:hypothetical protein
MSKYLNLLIILVSCWTLSATAAPPSRSSGSGGHLKCWINKDGVKECGNAVPPEYSQQGHSEVNKQGMVVDQKQRAKTKEELEAEQAAAEAAAAKKAEEERKRQTQAAQDKVLLATFNSEDDIILTRDGKLSNIAATIKLTESHLSKVQADLDKRLKDAADLERKGQKPSEEQQKDIAALRKQVADNERFIADKHKEQDSIRAQFDVDIQRFRDLTQKKKAAVGP